MKINVISPREAAGLPVTWGRCPTPWGVEGLVAWAERGLVYIGLMPDLGELEWRWPEAVLTRDDAAATRLAADIFSPRAGNHTLLFKGTPLQIAVWRALLEIPFGQTTSYAAVAAAAGYPRAIRAAASAVGRNDLSYLVPCHRVIRTDSSLGGYYSGLPLKEKILAWERVERS